MKTLTAIGVLLLSASAACAQNGSCGQERWPVKTLADSYSAGLVNKKAVTASISSLTSIAAPDRATLQKAVDTRFPQELTRYRISAVVIGFKRETDADFHIVLADPNNRRLTMIAEIPNSYCAPREYSQMFAVLQAQFEKDFGHPTAKFKKLATPVAVTVEGIFFFDFIHGQTGVAKNGAELHPLLSWEKN